MQRFVAATLVLFFVVASIPAVAVPAQESLPPFLPRILPVLLINLFGIGLDIYALQRLQNRAEGSSEQILAGQTAQIGFLISLSSALAYLSWFRLRK